MSTLRIVAQSHSGIPTVLEYWVDDTRYKLDYHLSRALLGDGISEECNGIREKLETFYKQVTDGFDSIQGKVEVNFGSYLNKPDANFESIQEHADEIKRRVSLVREAFETKYLKKDISVSIEI